ncbi:MAG: zinc-binding dehydrogenase, partial [Cytophagaceae bacterium]|nr:zinc-binding dehydrogenase [Gemmatimonadaceae bacterium]
TAAFERDVTPMLEDGRARPVVDRVFPLAEISAAHAAMESNETFGKVVIDMT